MSGQRRWLKLWSRTIGMLQDPAMMMTTSFRPLNKMMFTKHCGLEHFG